MLILISRRPDGLQVAAAEMAPSSHVLLPDGRFSSLRLCALSAGKLALHRINWHRTAAV
ncbi:hypothetical protein [Variovorax paradoxus]|uniref:hypothetical protein n=1 Tax=Variovorax paradoxus TaxID=34073 RepID=UPI001ABC8D90